MSWVIEEITTSTIGFIIAMVVLSAIIGVGLYGYWVYANHVTLENYLWPIAEVLPWKSEYFLAIVNTGHEPFTIEQIYLKGGSVITPSQAINPNLNWCSVSNTELMHNEWWCGEVNQLPVAVRVCSTLDPSVCVVAPVHGWETVTFSQPTQAAFGISNCPVLASVSDPYNAGWEVAWTMASGTYSVSESTSYQWCIDPPYYPITINFQSTITNNPSNYQCQISPQSTQVNYNGTPTTVPFTVTCQQSQTPPPPPPPPPPSPPPSPPNYPYFVYVTVTGDSYGADWSVSSSVYAISGSGDVSNQILYIAGETDTLTATILWSGAYDCTISPSSVSATNGSSYTFTVSCQGQQPPPSNNYFVYVSVAGDSYGASWQISSSVSSISGSSNVNNQQLQIGGPTDTLTATIISNPSGYQCSISPSSESVTAGNSYTFTVSCQPTTYYVYVTVTGDNYGAGWEISSSVASISGSGNVNNEQLQIGGPTDTLTAIITSSPPGYTCNINPTSIQATSGAYYTFTVSCSLSICS
jgi:hypothetical protein